MQFHSDYEFEKFYMTHPDIKDWLDKYRMIHVAPNTPEAEAGSENGILFTLELFMCLYLIYGETSKQYSKGIFHRMTWKHVVDFEFYQDENDSFMGASTVKKMSFSQTPTNPLDPSSHDNDTAIRSISFLLGSYFHKKGRIFKKFWHPRDIIYYNWLKGGWRRFLIYPFWPLMILFQAESCLSKYKVRNDTKIVVTDGKLLTWLRCHSTMHKSIVMKLSYKLCIWLLKRNNNLTDYQRGGNADISTWRKCFAYYFAREDHPVNKFMARIYDN